jgi:hypothetical protein
MARGRGRWHGDEARSNYAKALLRAAAELSAPRRTVVSYGLGFKFARDKGYGSRRVPCIKFYVRRKREEPSVNEKIPEWVTVRIQGRARRVRTDVEELKGSVAHSNGSCRLHVPDSRIGSCGFFIRSKENPDRHWVVTAGHVVVRPSGSGARCEDRLKVDGELNGPVVCDASYFKDSDGLFYDVGVARVRDELQQIRSDPQSSLRGSMPLQRLMDAMQSHEPLEFEVHSYTRRFRVAFDSVGMSPVSLSPGGKPRTYGPMLVYTREIGEDHYCPGDSGAPLTSTDGTQLVGVHFMGRGDGAGGKGCRPVGIALYAGTIKRLLEPALGELELALSS